MNNENERTPLLPLPINSGIQWIHVRPLTLDEIKIYGNTYIWIRIRQLFLCLLILLWCLLLLSSISIVLSTNSCNICFNSQQGIIEKIDYIDSLGVKAIWLSPIFKSPMKDFGYDISDYKAIDPLFGDWDDFKSLVQMLHEKNIKIILDFVPNHTSNEHEWFIKSIKKQDPYTDYYIWAKPKLNQDNIKIPPNNWISVFGGPAWTYNKERDEYYLHQFASEQPDLNFRNPLVMQEMKDILRFWLDAGVDGFRIDAISHLLEDEELRDEPISDDNKDSTSNEYSYLNHIYTHGLDGVLDIVKEFKQVIDEYKEPKLLMVEVYDSIENTMKYYGNNESPISDFPFNFLFLHELKSEKPTAEKVKSVIDKWMNNMPANRCPNWVLGNHDEGRVANRLNPELVDGMNMIILLLPGTSITYYGEEIAMTNTEITWEQTVDPAGLNAGSTNYTKYSRDPERTPMQWNSSKNAGFSESNSTWLPINSNYNQGINVEIQEKNNNSHLNIYRKLVQLKIDPVIKFGELYTDTIANNSLFTFIRYDKIFLRGYIIIVNFNEIPIKSIDIQEEINIIKLPNMAEIYISSISNKTNESNNIDLTNITVEAFEGIVIKFNINK